MNASSPPPSWIRRLLLKLSSEFVLGTVVALLSILTAVVAYQGAKVDGMSSGQDLEGQKQLTEANSLYLEANQFIIYDYTMFDGWYINTGRDDEIANYYQASFSDSLQSSMNRPDGPFDQQYYDDVYADAQDLYDEAVQHFEQANAYGDRSDNLQKVLLVFAVGLALSAYGSLLPSGKAIRIVFTVMALGALIAGVIGILAA